MVNLTSGHSVSKLQVTATLFTCDHLPYHNLVKLICKRCKQNWESHDQTPYHSCQPGRFPSKNKDICESFVPLPFQNMFVLKTKFTDETRTWNIKILHANNTARYESLRKQAEQNSLVLKKQINQNLYLVEVQLRVS